ncbi:MAG: carboxypeptidase regulatory-like domain-containing protein, partial [Oscillospiraceae bacterium]|nr:carboxypeptidase regulatory-like domain-containing protein [Oscillospiraceae bacterium]
MKIRRFIAILTSVISLGTFSILGTQSVAAYNSPVNDASNLLVNGSFEMPNVLNCGTSFFDQSLVPGWHTTNANGLIEIWGPSQRCYIGGGVPAVDGTQICEVNAKGPSDIYQDVELCPGDQVYWAIYHRGNLGTDTMNILIGAPGKEVVQKTVTTGKDWRSYSGYYTVPVGQTTTRIIFRSVSSFLGKTVNGNLVDGAYMKLVKRGVCPVYSSLSGTVTDKKTGLPIPNATVTITDDQGNTFTVTADENGRYVFDKIPNGNYTLQADADGYLEFTDNITINSNTTQNIELDPVIITVTVTGVVTDKETGVPIPNATVTLTDDQGNTFTAQTDKNGEYTINDVPTGDYTTNVTADLYNPETDLISVNEDTNYNAELDKTIVIVTVTGTVTDESTGLPIPNATVILTDKDGNTYTAKTDLNGEYTINDVPTGDYTTNVTADGYNPKTDSISVTDDTTYDAELSRTMVNVGGIVTDKDTKLPIPNATVTLTDKDGNTLTANTNSLGIYTINNVPTGDYTTKVTADGYGDLTGTLTVKDNPTTYNAELSHSVVNVGGLVTDKDTKLPISNATVTLTDKDGNTLTANT